MITIDIKPLSVNDAWQGRRFKTKKYLQYERSLLLMLPKMKIKKSKLKVSFIFGLTSCADIDNPIKLILDIMQKKYFFDDKDIFILNVEKILVKSGSEFFKFNIENI